MAYEFGGNKTPAWELVIAKSMAEVEDHKIEVIGENIDPAKLADGEIGRASCRERVSTRV